MVKQHHSILYTSVTSVAEVNGIVGRSGMIPEIGSGALAFIDVNRNQRLLTELYDNKMTKERS